MQTSRDSLSILIYFLAFRPVTIARCEVCASIYIAYISVSKSTPLAVTGPNGQLASIFFPENPNGRTLT